VFGFSWAEIFLTAAVALIVIGPKDIPKVMYQIGRVARRLQYVRFAMSQQFEDFLKEHDLDDLPSAVNFEAQNNAEIEADEEYMKTLPPKKQIPTAANESEGAADIPGQLPRTRSE
jgi:sec-independent protein translocase protein TatB